MNDKTDLVISNKDHYNNQNDQLDYFHFDLITYHKISEKFSLDLGLRQTESFKSKRWNPGRTYMLYGVYLVGELFTNINFQKVQTARLYGGFHLFRNKYFGIDVYYCYQKTRPNWQWKKLQCLSNKYQSSYLILICQVC